MIKVEKCKTKAAYSAKLGKKINLDKVRSKFDVVLDTPILVVVKVDGVEVIVHGYGELLFKKCDDVEKMQEIATKINKVGLSE